MKLTVLVDNNTLLDVYYWGEPGLSYYIEDGSDTILFDAGYSDVFRINAEKMGVDLDRVNKVVLSHGHVYMPGKFPADMPEGAVFLSGHTHVVKDEVVDGVRCMNPGSPSIPKENSAPSYIIIDGGEALLKTFD